MSGLFRWIAPGRVDMGHGGGMPETIKTVGFDPDFDDPLLDPSDELWRESLAVQALNAVKLARIVTPIYIEQTAGHSSIFHR